MEITETIQAGKMAIETAAKCGCGFCAICNQSEAARRESEIFIKALLCGFEESMLAVAAHKPETELAALQYLCSLQNMQIAQLRYYIGNLESEIDFLIHQPLGPSDEQWSAMKTDLKQYLKN